MKGLAGIPQSTSMKHTLIAKLARFNRFIYNFNMVPTTHSRIGRWSARLLILTVVHVLVTVSHGCDKNEGGVGDEMINTTSVHMAGGKRLSALVLTESRGSRHPGLDAAMIMLNDHAWSRNWQIELSGNLMDPSGVLRDLESYDVIVFLLTTGSIFNKTQKKAFQRYVEKGGAVACINRGVTTHRTWKFFTSVIGARFHSSADSQEVRFRVLQKRSPIVRGIPHSWVAKEEVFNFRKPLELSKSEVLVAADDKSFTGGKHGTFHPVTWARRIGKVRSCVWVTTLGYLAGSYVGKRKADKALQRQILMGIEWAAMGTKRARKIASKSN